MGFFVLNGLLELKELTGAQFLFKKNSGEEFENF